MSETSEPQADSFRPGETVRVTDGTFAGKEGRIVGSRGGPNLRLYLVMLTIFGRETPVELESGRLRRP